MTKKQKHHKKAALPKRPPKKTGKRGPRPVDPSDDFLAATTRQTRLPGMEDSAIEEIEAAAHRYKETMNKRLSVLRQEVDQGNLLLGIMKKHGKKTYRHDGVFVTTTETKEKVKVKIGEAEEIEQEAFEAQAASEARAEDDAKQMAAEGDFTG